MALTNAPDSEQPNADVLREHAMKAAKNELDDCSKGISMYCSPQDVDRSKSEREGDGIEEWEQISNGYKMSLNSEGMAFVSEGPAGYPVDIRVNTEDNSKFFGEDSMYYYNNIRPTSDGTGFVFPEEGILKPQQLQ